MKGSNFAGGFFFWNLKLCGFIYRWVGSPGLVLEQSGWNEIQSD